MFERLWLVVAVCILSSACGGAAAPGSSSAACSVTLAGAMSGSHPCIGEARVTYDSSGDRSLLRVLGPDDGSPLAFEIAVSFPGLPRAATLDPGSADVEALIRANPLSGPAGSEVPVYFALAGSPQPGDDRGSYTLTFTQVTQLSSAGNPRIYAVHGSIVATLPADPDTGASGTVSLRASF
jgi:hypothetical protein